MTLAPCRECGHQISDLAAACPHCGAPVAAAQPAAAHAEAAPNVAAVPIAPIAVAPSPLTELEQWVFNQLVAGTPRREVVHALVYQSGMDKGSAERLAKRMERRALHQRGGTPVRQGSGGNVAAALASFFIPGLGQLTQGRAGAGVGMFFLSAVLWFVLLGWVVNIWSAVDAAKWDPDE